MKEIWKKHIWKKKLHMYSFTLISSNLINMKILSESWQVLEGWFLTEKNLSGGAGFDIAL